MRLRAYPTGYATTHCILEAEEETVESREDARRYLEGADYPTDKHGLMSAARSNGAPEGFAGRLRGLGDTEFSNLEEVLEALDRLKEPGRHPPSGGRA